MVETGKIDEKSKLMIWILSYTLNWGNTFSEKNTSKRNILELNEQIEQI